MAKNPSNGNVKVAWILDSALTEKEFPLAATITGALELTDAISWKNFKIGADESADIDDRSLLDLGNAVSRGAAKYGANLSFFRDQNSTDITSSYRNAFEAFRVKQTIGWLIVRVGKSAALPWAAGDEVSLYKLMANTTSDTTDGEETTKMVVDFLANGSIHVHTMLGGAGTITGVPTTLSKTVAAGPFQLQPILAGASIVSRAKYVSSDLTLAKVSRGGTVTPIGAGSPTISVSYGAATSPVVVTLTLT